MYFFLYFPRSEKTSLNVRLVWIIMAFVFAKLLMHNLGSPFHYEAVLYHCDSSFHASLFPGLPFLLPPNFWFSSPVQIASNASPANTAVPPSVSFCTFFLLLYLAPRHCRVKFPIINVSTAQVLLSAVMMSVGLKDIVKLTWWGKWIELGMIEF